MLNWIGAKDVDTSIEIWFGDQGSGSVELFEVGNPTPLAQGFNRLSYVLPARSQAINLRIITATTRPTPGAIPLFMEATQNGNAVAAFEDATPANGIPPKGPARFKNPVPNGTPGRRSTTMAFR